MVLVGPLYVGAFGDSTRCSQRPGSRTSLRSRRCRSRKQWRHRAAPDPRTARSSSSHRTGPCAGNCQRSATMSARRRTANERPRTNAKIEIRCFSQFRGFADIRGFPPLRRRKRAHAAVRIADGSPCVDRATPESTENARRRRVSAARPPQVNRSYTLGL